MSERRRYFRIDDEFQVRVVPSNGGPRPSPGVPLEARELGQALARLRQKLPEAAEAIELIARRITVLEHQGETEGLSPAEIVQGSNISGCGIAFHSRRPVAAGQLLDLDLVLDTGAVQLHAVGRVVSCAVMAPPDAGCLVRVDFVDIAADDEETLVQYVLRRQLRQLRRGREADEQRSDRTR